MKKILTIFATIAIHSSIATTAQATSLPTLTATQSNPNITSLARRDSQPKVNIQHTKASSQLRNFRPRKFQAGKKTIVLGSNDMKSILGKHHPKAYRGRSNSPTTETLFPRKTKTAQITKAIGSVFNQNRQNISQGKTPITGTYKGKIYELGYDKRGRIRHFFPKK